MHSSRMLTARFGGHHLVQAFWLKVALFYGILVEGGLLLYPPSKDHPIRITPHQKEHGTRQEVTSTTPPPPPPNRLKTLPSRNFLVVIKIDFNAECAQSFSEENVDVDDECEQGFTSFCCICF